MGSPSPTKERDKDVSPKHYSRKAENRIVKRRSERSRSKKRINLRDDEGDDSDNEQPGPAVPPKDAAGPVQQTFAMSLAGFLSWVEAHPNLPSVLSYYLQLTVNMFLGSLFIYIVYSAWAGVMTDVDIESSKHASEVMVEIAQCAMDYNRNRCRPEEVVPAMEKACGIWETCMNRDPKKVARASVTAKTFAMIFNSFVEEFSYKSMVCFTLFIFIWGWVNATFFRVRHECRRHMNDEERVWQHQYYARCRAYTQLPCHAQHPQSPTPNTRSRRARLLRTQLATFADNTSRIDFHSHHNLRRLQPLKLGFRPPAHSTTGTNPFPATKRLRTPNTPPRTVQLLQRTATISAGLYAGLPAKLATTPTVPAATHTVSESHTVCRTKTYRGSTVGACTEYAAAA
jgi:hypothetical protein